LKDQSIHTALVVEGGALRGVFSTGLLDGFLVAKFNPFDLFIGVSSGATNLAAYLAEMMGRNGTIYMDYSLRPEFINFSKFFHGGHLIDLDWLWAITIREIRLDLGTIYSKAKPFIVVLTDVQTGNAVYKMTNAGELEEILKASSAMPLLYRDFPKVEGRPMTDGGVADALPVREAIHRGATHIMVIRSRPRDYIKQNSLTDYFMRWYVRHSPFLRLAMTKRVQRYNEAVALIRKPPEGISIIEICPPEHFRVSRLSQDPLILQEGYNQGRTLATEAIALWKTAVFHDH
jgi:predicted patatin/cPLA2 family phospholipase